MDRFRPRPQPPVSLTPYILCGLGHRPNPLLGRKFSEFCTEWTAWISEYFHADLDILVHYQSLWTLNIPVGLKGLLWKSSSRSLLLGPHWYGPSDLGQNCHCGKAMSLPHVWSGCSTYDLSPLKDILLALLASLCPGDYRVLDYDKWPSPFWFLLLVLKPLEKQLEVSKKQLALLKDSWASQERAIGGYLWYIWRQRMKETVVPSFSFVPYRHVALLASYLDAG